jgi:hypothetical protein
MATPGCLGSIDEFRARCENLINYSDYRTYGHEAWNCLEAVRTNNSFTEQERLLRMAYAYYYVCHSLVQTIRFGARDEREAMIAFQFCLSQGVQCFQQALGDDPANGKPKMDKTGEHYAWREKLLELDKIVETNRYHEEAAYEAEKLRSSAEDAAMEAVWRNL